MRTLTDEQIIERIRRVERYRRPAGIVFLFVGIAATAALMYYVNDLRQRSITLFAQFQPGIAPTSQQSVESFNAAQFYSGFALGSAFITGLASACILALVGFALMLPNRKDRLLLQCWGNQRGGPLTTRCSGPAPASGSLGPCGQLSPPTGPGH